MQTIVLTSAQSPNKQTDMVASRHRGIGPPPLRYCPRDCFCWLPIFVDIQLLHPSASPRTSKALALIWYRALIW